MLLAFLVQTAFAVPAFPGLVADDVGMPCTPTCALCHNSTGGGGPASQPFGKQLVRRGLVAYDAPSLQAALDSLQADAIDSDGDGVADVDELIDGTNPNPGGRDFCSLDTGGGGGTVPDVKYGCSTAAAPLWGPWLAAAALISRRAGRRGPRQPARRSGSGS